MSLDAFWGVIDAQLTELKSAKSADDVIRLLSTADGLEAAGVSSAPAFFAGGGGDGSVSSALREAGWTAVWYEADYYWAMRAPDGSGITYVEGDIYPEIQRPL